MGEMKKDVLFGTSVFGGFNRKDVIEYIDALQRSATQSGSKEDETASLLRTEQIRTQALTQELEKMQSENDALRAENERLTAVEKELEAIKFKQLEAEKENEPEETEESFSAVVEDESEEESDSTNNG